MLCSNKCCLSQRFNTTIIRKEGLSDFESNFFYLTLKLYLPSLIKRTVEIIVELTKKTGRDKNSSISVYHLFFSPRATLPLLLHARARTYYTRTRGEPRQTRWASRAKEKKNGSLKREREREREFSFHEKTQKRRNLKTKVKRGRPLEIAS